MKILWFANSPCGASNKLLGSNYTKGGWLSSLESLLIDDERIELSVAFYWVKKLAPFKQNRTSYYPVLRYGCETIGGRLFNKYFNRKNDKVEIDRLLNVVAVVQPDIIHIHGTEDNYGLIQAYTKIPVAVSIQGLLSTISLKYFAGIPFPIANKYEGFKPKLMASSVRRRSKAMRVNAVRERKILSISSHIIGRTDWDKRVTRVLAPESNYYVVQEMLRPLFFTRRWSKTKFESPLRIVSTSGPGLYKGLETIIRAAQILTVNKRVDYEWLIPGLEESSTIARMVKRWLALDFNGINLKFLGSKSESDLVDILVSSDIYCQASHIENSPNSLCEAMLIGIPCIASFAGGTDSLLQDKKEGILVQDGDPYSLAGAIYQLSQDFETTCHYAANARKRAKNRHDISKIGKDTLDVYNEIISHLHH